MSYSGSRGPPTIEGMTSLKVDNLTYRTNVDELKRAFQKFGDVGDIYIPRQKDGESRGFAFVRFYEKRDAEDAMDAIDGSILDGREIRVQNAKYGRPSHNMRRSSGHRDRGHYDGQRSYRDRRSPVRRRRSRSRSHSPRRRSPPRRRHSRSRSRSPRRKPQSRSPEQAPRRSGSRSPRREKSRSPSGSPKRRSPSPAGSQSPPKERSKSRSPEAED